MKTAFVLTSKYLIIWLLRNHTYIFNSNLYDSNSLSQIMSEFNPIEIPLMQKDSYIKSQYQKIIKDNKISTEWLDFKSPWYEENLKISVPVGFIYLFIYFCIFGSLQDFILGTMAIALTYPVLVAWCTFNSLQTSDMKAIKLTIIIFIILLIAFIII